MSSATMTPARAWRARDNRAAMIVGGLLATVILAFWLWPSAEPTPTYEYGKSYPFQYSLLSTATTTDGRTVQSRLFIFERDGVTFSSPVESYGRRITVLDRTLAPNTFRIVRQKVPVLAIGERIFDPGSEFDQVRYNMRHLEPQRVVPRVTSRNTPPATGKR